MFHFVQIPIVRALFCCLLIGATISLGQAAAQGQSIPINTFKSTTPSAAPTKNSDKTVSKSEYRTDIYLKDLYRDLFDLAQANSGWEFRVVRDGGDTSSIIMHRNFPSLYSIELDITKAPGNYSPNEPTKTNISRLKKEVQQTWLEGMVKDPATASYYALDKDEKSRLANYAVGMNNLLKSEPNMPDFYIINNKIDFKMSESINEMRDLNATQMLEKIFALFAAKWPQFN